MFYPKAVVTASRTGIALSCETCLLGAVSLPVLCWFHLQQIPELNLMAPRLLPHFRTIIPFLPTNPNLANVPDKESGEDSMSRLHYRQECSIIHKQKLLGATSNTILVLCLSSFLLPQKWINNKAGAQAAFMRKMSRNNRQFSVTSLRHWTKATNYLLPNTYFEKNKPFFVYATEVSGCYY